MRMLAGRLPAGNLIVGVIVVCAAIGLPFAPPPSASASPEGGRLFPERLPWGSPVSAVRQLFPRLARAEVSGPLRGRIAVFSGVHRQRGIEYRSRFMFSGDGLYEVEYRFPEESVEAASEAVLTELLDRFGPPVRQSETKPPVAGPFRERMIIDMVWQPDGQAVGYRRIEMAWADGARSRSLYVTFRAGPAAGAADGKGGARLLVLGNITVDAGLTGHLLDPARRFMTLDDLSAYPLAGVRQLAAGALTVASATVRDDPRAVAGALRSIDVVPVAGGDLAGPQAGELSGWPFLADTAASIEAGGLSLALIQFSFRTDGDRLNGRQIGSAAGYRAEIDAIKRRVAAVIRPLAGTADAVVALPVWGNGRNRCPLPFQVEMGRWLVESGARAVIGFNPGVVNGYEEYRGAVILYSAGDLLAPAPDQPPFAVRLRIDRSGSRIEQAVPLDPARPYQPVPAVGASATAFDEASRSCRP